MGPASPRVTPQPRGGRGGAGPGLWRPNADWQWEAHPVGPWRAQAGQPRQPGPAQPASGARVERQVHAGRGRGSRSRCPSGLRLLRASGTRRCGVAGARGGLRGTGAPQPASRTGAPAPGGGGSDGATGPVLQPRQVPTTRATGAAGPRPSRLSRRVRGARRGARAPESARGRPAPPAAAPRSRPYGRAGTRAPASARWPPERRRRRPAPGDSGGAVSQAARASSLSAAERPARATPRPALKARRPAVRVLVGQSPAFAKPSEARDVAGAARTDPGLGGCLSSSQVGGARPAGRGSVGRKARAGAGWPSWASRGRRAATGRWDAAPGPWFPVRPDGLKGRGPRYLVAAKRSRRP